MATIAILNVNTTATMTELMVKAARQVVHAETNIIGITPKSGPVSVESHLEASLAVVGMAEAIATHPQSQQVDAWVLGGFGDYGKETLMEMCAQPVVDITEAAATTAMALGDTYSIITTLERTIPGIRDRLLTAGLLERCTGIFASEIPVIDLEAHRDQLLEVLSEQIRAQSLQHGEVLCLGCAGMAGLAPELSRNLGIPVVDPVTAAVCQAEGLIQQGLSTSRKNSYARRTAKPITGFAFVQPQAPPNP